MNNEKKVNFTFNFYAPVGQNIAHVDKVEAHFDKDMTMQVVDTEQIIKREDESGISVQTHSPEAIIQYVMKLHPTCVSKKWKDHYQDLWEKVLEIPEVEAVIYNKGRQRDTTFNRNLVGNILCLMADEKVQVLCEDNATKLTLALENTAGASIRAQLGIMPERGIKTSITEIIETFLT